MTKKIILRDRIVQSIYFLRGQKVLLDFDLAMLYGVTTKVLNQAVKRNQDRSPEDAFVKVRETLETKSGERTRLACWRWHPRHRELVLHGANCIFSARLRRSFSARRRKGHARRVRSPIRCR